MKWGFSKRHIEGGSLVSAGVAGDSNRPHASVLAPKMTQGAVVHSIDPELRRQEVSIVKGAPTLSADGGSASLGGAPGAALSEATVRSPFVVPVGYHIRGSLFVTRPVEVRGEVGRLLATGDVTICAGGVSSGPVKGRRIVVHGEVRDALVASERVELQAGGRIVAPLTAPVLSVAPGGTLATDSISVGYESRGE